MPVIDLVRQLRAEVGAEAADYVHWGATTQDIVDTFLHFRDGSEQRNRIQISLQGSIVTDGLPAVIERDSPIQADHISASLTH